jgi:transketolase
MKKAFFDLLTSASEVNKSIGLLTIDLGFNAVEEFAQRFPERFWNLGITEQSSMGIASGLAAEGFMPFVYSIANFTTFRAAEQIRNDIAYENRKVRVVSAGGGVQYGALGYSHHAIQDFGLMRQFPNLTICSPTTLSGLEVAMKTLLSADGPGYLRLSVASPETTNSRNLVPGVVELPEKCVLVTGDLGSLAMSEIEHLLKGGFELFYVPVWGEPHATWVAEKLIRARQVVSFETHLAAGGFGSWLLELRQDYSLGFELRRHVVKNSIIGAVGPREYLLSLHSGYSEAGKV